MQLPVPITAKLVIYAGLVLFVTAGAVWWFFDRTGSDETQFLTVYPSDFVQSVSVSGKVVAVDDVDLAFEATGKVDRIFTAVGDRVEAGAPLVGLSLGTLTADLAAAEADLLLKRTENENTQMNVDEVRKEEDTQVESAYRELLSDDLVALPDSTAYGVTAPAISGLYEGKAQGVYRLRIERGVQSDRYILHVSGLEKVDSLEISKTSPAPLGTQGLFVSFPDGVAAYRDTKWKVSIPNEKGVSYVDNHNAYEEALRGRDKALADAQAELARRSGGSTVAEAQVDLARAEVARIQTQIAQRTLRAPFAGVVTALDARLGETVASGEHVLSMMGVDTLQIESYVPEINISLVQVGDRATVTLDAYGATVAFLAKVVSVDPAETLRDGVSTYRVKLQFEARDERVRSGMTANIVITTLEKSNVLSVPQGLVKERDGQKIIWVKQGASAVERPVSVGAVSSMGLIEITSGLQAGESVLLSPPSP